MSPTYRASGRSVLKVYAHPGERAFVADIMLTPSGAKFAAHSLNIGACHIEPHRTLGARVQPGAPREVVEQRARELAQVVEQSEEERYAERYARAWAPCEDCGRCGPHFCY